MRAARDLESVQRQLSEYLQCELYHLLGAYGVAEEHLAELADRLAAEAEGRPSSFDPTDAGTDTGSAVLARLVELAGQFNHTLGWNRYASDPQSRDNPSLNHSADPDSWPVREPLPTGLPMTPIDRFAVGPKDGSMQLNRESPWSSDKVWDRIPRFYGEALAAIEGYAKIPARDDHYQELPAGASPEERLRANQINFARGLLASRDGAAGWREKQAARQHLEHRVERYEDRLRSAIERIGSDLLSEQEIDETAKAFRGEAERTELQEKFLDLVVNNQPPTGEESLSVFVLRVQGEAHLSMHAVEAWRSMCIGEHAEAIGEKQREWLERELERSIALSTFAYCVSRTAPWIFAKSDEERRKVISDVSTAWENLVPVRCMWIASQVSLLSLHRRAYARALQDNAAAAYNDYHKLQHLIRDTERRVGESPLHIGGARGFLAGLNAEAHHHIGELYRAEHAHKPALEHFEAASHRLELLREDDETFDRVLKNSRWYVELQISRGKACYEMGRHKEALYWYLRAWKAFLDLLSSETETETNTAYIVESIDWLESVKFEPELRKAEISERIGPVVEQLDRITAVGRVGALAAEILLRLGHLLFVLNLGYFDPRKVKDPSRPPDRELAAQERVRSTLAFSCFSKAAECDPYSTLVGADLMKAQFRFNTWWDRDLPDAYKEIVEQGVPKRITQHWPRGGGDYERLARMAEYLMLNARKYRFAEDVDAVAADETDGLIARDLLLDLFMSTDSINVRKSQIHRFLMQKKLPPDLPCGQTKPAIELICMRRYSSPFPLLPRPSAFRALGGGYFLRLHPPKPERDGEASEAVDESGPYGVVVDPGVDFVENLYRAGYSLGDIDMMVITHDHVDHLGALDPLLSLLHVRSQILKDQRKNEEETPARKVVVLTSKSVHDRYERVTQLSGEKARHFVFHCFEQKKSRRYVIDLGGGFGFPDEFEIVATSSTAGASRAERRAKKDGHRDLSEEPSHGLCFRLGGGDGPSVAITSDTPPPPPAEEDERYREWKEAWGPALAADVLVVHLGSVPLTELRQLDRLRGSSGEDETWREGLERDEGKLELLRGSLQDADPKLQGQIEYAQWLRSHEPKTPQAQQGKYTARIVGQVPDEWLPPPEHNFLVGLLRWANEFEAHRWPKLREPGRGGDGGPQGLFVIGELSEELGTMRGKVAARLNRRLFATHQARKRSRRGRSARIDGFPYALTADIGLHAVVHRSDDGGGNQVKVLCTNCNLDNDRTPEESYHAAHDVYEVCVKGENEGIFYNCIEHDPARQDEPAFLEQLERFDIFGR